MTHLLRYLLIFGERKKKVELSVSNGLENVKVKTLKQKARELFNLKNVLLQIWDKGFEDWVDLDEGDPTPTNSRIKVEVDKEAKSVSDISVANRMPSKPAAVKPSLLVGTPKAKADPPMVQVLSSYPMMSMTTTEPSQASPTSKALPALALIKQPHPQAVAPKLSPGKPRKILPAGQRQFMGEQPQAQGSQAPGRTSQAPRRTSQVPERTSSLSAGEMLGVRQDIQDDSYAPTCTCHQPYPTVPSHSEDRPVVDYIQQSFSLPTRIPDRTLPPSQEDAPSRRTMLHLQNKPAMDVLQQSLPLQYLQSSRIPERRSVLQSQENVSCQMTSSESQNKLAMETAQQSFPAPYMHTSRIPERILTACQDVAPYPQMTTSPAQNPPEVQVVQESCPSMPFSKTSRIPVKTLPHSQNPPLHHQATTSHSQSKPEVQVAQEACSSKPYTQTSKISQRHLPPSQDDVPPPITIEDEISSTGQEEEQMEEVDHPPILDNDKLFLSDYKLPQFPPDVIQKLDYGIPIDAKDRSILLDTLYESVVPYSYYPTTSDYTYLTKTFLERYPQLLHQAGPIRDCPDDWEAWRQKVMHKFKNKRKRQDRDAPGVRQHKRMNCMKHFEGLDELQSAARHTTHDRGHSVDIDCPGGVNDEVFEVVDDDQDVVIKDEDSMCHVMAADTTNLCDTTGMGVAQESLTSPSTSQNSRIQERTFHPFQVHLPQRLNPLQSQNNLAMECVQESLSSPRHMQNSRTLDRRFPSSQDNMSFKQTTAHLLSKPVMGVIQDFSSARSYRQASRFPEGSLPQSQDHSQDNALNQQTMPSSQNQPVMEVEQESCSSSWHGQTSKIPGSFLVPSQDHAPAIIIDKDLASSSGQEQRLMEVQRGNSPTSCDPDKPSLYDYKLPEFHPDTLQKLENGIPIDTRDRSTLLDTLYESVVPYTYYPSAADYIYLTNIFLKQYPQLLPQAGPIRDCPDNWEAWRQKLMHKFKNRRKRQDRDAPAVREHTRKNFKYFEGLDEFQGASGQALIEKERDWINSACPSEANDDDVVFEVVDDVEDIVVKDEDSMYHVMAADTTNLGDTPIKGAVQDSVSLSPYIQSSRIPERNLPGSQDDPPYRLTTSHLQNKPIKEVAQEPCSLQPYMQMSKLPERTLSSSQAVDLPFTVKEDLSSSSGERKKQLEIQHMKSAPASEPEMLSLYDYELPKFPPDIIQKLEHGIPIESKDRSILLDTLYESIVPYTFYPSASDYIYFTKILLEQYPQLLPQAGPIRDCPDNWEAWRQKLMHKFKNKRKRQDRDAPAVQEHTRKNVFVF